MQNFRLQGPADYDTDHGIHRNEKNKYVPAAVGSFRSKTIRKDAVNANKQKANIPGVGNYEIEKASKSLENSKFKVSSSAFVSANARFKDNNNGDGPAPGDYGNDHTETQMNTRSYNITVM